MLKGASRAQPQHCPTSVSISDQDTVYTPAVNIGAAFCRYVQFLIGRPRVFLAFTVHAASTQPYNIRPKHFVCDSHSPICAYRFLLLYCLCLKYRRPIAYHRCAFGAHVRSRRYVRDKLYCEVLIVLITGMAVALLWGHRYTQQRL